MGNRPPKKIEVRTNTGMTNLMISLMVEDWHINFM